MLIYENKRDIQECESYKAIKSMNHIMKVQEKVTEKRLSEEIIVTKNQFGYLPGTSTTEPIFCVKQLRSTEKKTQQ